MPDAPAIVPHGRAVASQTVAASPTPLTVTSAPVAPQYETTLSPEEEQQFSQWKMRYAPHDTGEDYDLRGAFRAGLKPDAVRGHFPDTYKKPNHPTFSVESMYSTPDQPGGAWGRIDGRDTFEPSSFMMKDSERIKNLQNYFKKREPAAKLILPATAAFTPNPPMGAVTPIQAGIQ